jgi:hypothetical protein
MQAYYSPTTAVAGDGDGAGYLVMCGLDPRIDLFEDGLPDQVRQ